MCLQCLLTRALNAIWLMSKQGINFDNFDEKISTVFFLKKHLYIFFFILVPLSVVLLPVQDFFPTVTNISRAYQSLPPRSLGWYQGRNRLDALQNKLLGFKTGILSISLNFKFRTIKCWLTFKRFNFIPKLFIKIILSSLIFIQQYLLSM